MPVIEAVNEIDLGRYKPIKNGGLRLLIVVVGSFPIGCVSVLISHHFLTSFVPAGPNSWAYQLLGVTMAALLLGALGIAAYCLALNGQSFTDYIRRNIVGYLLICERAQNSETKVRTGCNRYLYYRGQYQMDLASNKMFFIVPLGGWLARNRIFFGNHFERRNGREDLNGWKVKLERCFRYGIDEPLVPMVRLSDYTGNSVVVRAKQALEILYQFMIKGGAIENNLEGVIRKLLDIEREYDKQVSFEGRYIEALNTIERTIERLDATKRYIKSAQAKDIRAWLVVQLLILLPENDPRREKYALRGETRTV